MLKKIFFLIVFAAFVIHSNAQTGFTLTVSQRDMSMDDELYVDYTVNGTREDVGMPQVNLDSWNVLSGPNTSTNFSIINGKRSSSVAYGFVLKPKRTGQLTVPAAEIVIGGNVYKSNSVTVNVHAGRSGNNAGQQQPPPSRRGGSIFDIFDDIFGEPSTPRNPSMRPGQSAAEFMKENNFVKVTPSKQIVYIGEPILVTYEFYSGMSLTSANVIKQPSFNGASVIEMTEEKPPFKTNHNGREYMVSRIRQAQLIPLKTGNITLEPAEVATEIMVNDNYGLSANKQSTTIKNAPLNITVQPLPPGAPAGFSGNVGQFSISANVERTNLPAGETNYLTVTINGEGNIDGIKQPVINFSNDIQSFQATDSQSVNKQIFPMQGTKIFKIPFIGQNEGAAVIPAISFSYFDNIENAYKTVTTQPINITFTAPLKKGVFEREVDSKGYSRTGWILIVGAIGILVIAGLLFFGRKKKDNQSAKKQEPNIKPINPNNYTAHPQKEVVANNNNNSIPKATTAQIQQQMRNNITNEIAVLDTIAEENNFYSKAKSTLLQIVRYKLNTDTYSEYSLMEELKQSNFSDIQKQDYKNLLDKINKGSYLPIVNMQERQEVLNELKYIFQNR